MRRPRRQLPIRCSSRVSRASTRCERACGRGRGRPQPIRHRTNAPFPPAAGGARSFCLWSSTSRCAGFLNAWLRFFPKDMRGLLRGIPRRSLPCDEFARGRVMTRNETPAESLKGYLRQLSPQTRSRLLAEVERLRQSGEDIPGGDLLLGELRAEFRQDGRAFERLEQPARHFFRPLE